MSLSAYSYCTVGEEDGGIKGELEFYCSDCPFRLVLGEENRGTKGELEFYCSDCPFKFLLRKVRRMKVVKVNWNFIAAIVPLNSF